MITIRKSAQRGHFDHGWLKTYHTFSFADYQDPEHMNFRALRVINEDFVATAKGFGTHPHRDMEILTYILAGELQHQDSMGNGSVIRPGDVQRMSAGTGVTHSEFNPSSQNAVHLLQIWLLPEKANLQPSYEQKFFTTEQKRNTLCLVASQNGKDGSVTIHQDVLIYASILAAGQSLTYDIAPTRSLWLQMARGSLTANTLNLSAGDGCAITNESRITLQAQTEAEILIFDLA